MNNRVCGESVNTARDGRHLLDAWSTDATPSDVQSRERRRRYPSDMSAAGPLLDHSTSREGGGPHINGPHSDFGSSGLSGSHTRPLKRQKGISSQPTRAGKNLDFFAEKN